MKTILALCVAIALAGAFGVYKATRPAMLYGRFTGAPKAEVSELIARPKENMGKTWALEGVITKQCTSMGCFFFFQDGGNELRVELAEIAMHAPRGRNGRPAAVEGQMAPYGEGYQFVATAVEFK